MTRNLMDKNLPLHSASQPPHSLAPAARAADDTARFYGAWITNLCLQRPDDGRAVDPRRQRVIGITCGLPFSVTPAGNGSLSRSQRQVECSRRCAQGDNAGTYTFIDDNTAVLHQCRAVCNLAAHHGPMPAGITPPNYQQLTAAYQRPPALELRGP